MTFDGEAPVWKVLTDTVTLSITENKTLYKFTLLTLKILKHILRSSSQSNTLEASDVFKRISGQFVSEHGRFLLLVFMNLNDINLIQPKK